MKGNSKSIKKRKTMAASCNLLCDLCRKGWCATAKLLMKVSVLYSMTHISGIRGPVGSSPSQSLEKCLAETLHEGKVEIH